MASTTLPTLQSTTAASSTITVVSGSPPSIPERSVSSQSLDKGSAGSVASSEEPPSKPDPSVPVLCPRKSSAFWLSYAAVCLCTFVSALDITEAHCPRLPFLPRCLIVDLSGSAASAWVGSSYTLASAALVPFTGNLANIFGRRPIMLGSIILFALGSALAGSAQSMEWLIIARVVQGMGGGGMTGLSSIIVADLVPLAERGAYQDFKTMMWTCAAGSGPILGGALSQKASWRWLFYINLPASAFAFLFVLIFLRVRTPSGDIWSKLRVVDWFGNFLLITGTILSNISLTWAVLVPLVIGIALMKYIPSVPTMHWDVVTNRTALASLIATFINGVTSISIVCFLPLFFQAVFLVSPLDSAIYAIPSCLLISPFSFMHGIVVLKIKCYLPGNYVGWIMIIVGFGVVSMLGADSSLALRVASQIIVAAGTGVVISALPFALMAPIPVSRLGSALAFQSFLRTVSQTWGITISGAILQNTVKHRFPARFLKELPAGSDFEFSALSRIAALPEPMQHEVKITFGQGISTIYWVMIATSAYFLIIGVSGLGLLCVLFMKEVPMCGNVDAKFGLKEKGEKGGKGDVEKGSVEKVETETETDEKAEVETEEVAEVERLKKV
ncbi:iron permease [Mycena olivaceomarginata]|nr:iron permease [Mycena olivaceomarginata]